MAIKKLLTCIIACAMLSSVLWGCGDADDDNDTGRKSSENKITAEITSDEPSSEDEMEDKTEDDTKSESTSKPDKDKDAETEATSKKPDQKTSEPSTEESPKESGVVTTVTNEDGIWVQSPVQVVQPDNGGISSGGADLNAPDNTDPGNSDHRGKTEKMYVFWMDVSENKNYQFEGNFIKLTFKVRSNVPDGDYPIDISPDTSDVNGMSFNSKTKSYNGTVRIGGDIAAQDVSSETGFTFYADNVSCNAGDTIDYYISIKNNPGIAAMVLWVSYDSNAMEYLGYETSGDFADAAKRIQAGKKD